MSATILPDTLCIKVAFACLTARVLKQIDMNDTKSELLGWMYHTILIFNP